ncbi:hypothetical protein JTB14_010791 [Gonioctena quinquepunctata]|nr:hypothetical protein JTB14_010791 [Gonioctena quinquepunctata]
MWSETKIHYIPAKCANCRQVHPAYTQDLISRGKQPPHVKCQQSQTANPPPGRPGWESTPPVSETRYSPKELRDLDTGNGPLPNQGAEDPPQIQELSQ